MYKTEETKSIELFAAIEKRDIEEAVRLINAEADVNAVDKNGAAPLHMAAECGCTKIVEVLIKNGADVNVVIDKNERTPLHIAAVKDNAETIKVLIEAGADVNKVENSGKTPLHFAAFKGRSKAIKVLIDLGVNIEAKDQKGRTPLHEASENPSTKGVKVLIEAGADVNAVDKDEFTPLYMPVLYCYGNITDIVKLLIEAGADVNKVSMSGTLFHWADRMNRTNIYDIVLNQIARLEIAGLYVSSSNLNKKQELISDSRNLHNDYLQYLENSRREVKKMEKENKPLYDFLKESDIAKLVSIFEKNEGVRSILDDQKGLRKQYSEYAYILISKANEVKKEIFLHNHKPLIDVLSKNYEKDFQKMSFVGIRNFFDVHRNDYRVKDRSISLINFVDLEDIATRNVPKLKVRALVEEIKNKVINSNLECPSTEQPQELNRAFN